MNRNLLTVAALLITNGATAWGILSWQQRAQQAAVAQAQAVAQAHVQQATAHATEGAHASDQAQAQATVNQASSREVSRLRAENAKLKADLEAKPDPVTVEDLQPRVAKLEELVDAQDKHIGGLTLELDLTRESRDQFRLAFEDERRARVTTEMALQAQIAANKNALWRGRIEGLAVGIGAGLLVRR